LAKTNYTRLIIFNNTELIKPRLIISFHPHKSISEAVDTQTPPKLWSRVLLHTGVLEQSSSEVEQSHAKHVLNNSQ
jgi:hypothetical protein